MPHAFVNGIWLNYQDVGEGDPVLLVMGLGAPLQGWELQVPVLAKKHRVVTFDNRGVGRSEKPGGRYSIAAMVEDAKQLLDHLKIERAHVVGMSMGGMIAMELAALHPSRVRSLTLAATTPFADARLRWTIGRGVAQVSAAMARANGSTAARLAAGQEATVQLWLPLVFSGKLGPEQERMLRKLMDAAFAEGFSTAGTVGQLTAVMGHDARLKLPRIQVPTLVLGGTDDAIFHRGKFEHLAFNIEGARLELFEGAPHGLNFIAADAFNEEEVRFLAAQR